MPWKIPLFRTYSDEEDVEAVAKVIRRGSYWAIGPEIEEFEKRVAEFLGVKYALTFNSGTSALHAVLQANEIKGLEVIVPSFTFIATANSVILAGGKPVFAEVEPETFALDADDVRQRITSETKAIMPIHYAGFPARDIKELRKIADDNGLLLIEDAAEALGARIGNKLAGTFGHSAIFSFCQNKVISTGEGGLVVTNFEKVYEKAKLMRSHGRVELAEDYFSSTGDNDYIEAGYNLRMPTMLAALGISQLNKLDKLFGMRRKLAFRLNKELSGIKGITIPEELPDHYSVYQMYTIKLEDKKTRDSLQAHLAKAGIMSKVYFNPVHLKTLYTRQYSYMKGDLPKTESLSDIVLTLPFYPHMTEEELIYLAETVKAFFNSR